MKKIILVLLLLTGTLAHAQMTRDQAKAMYFTKKTPAEMRATFPNACYFYNSLEDYNHNKPISDVEWDPYSYSMTLGAEKITVKNKGNEEKVKIKELPYNWVTTSDGTLMRKYDGVLYQIVVNGPICYYIRFKHGDFSGSKNNYSFSRNNDDKFFDFYSQTINGEILEMNNKVMEDLLEKHSLLEQYKSEKIKREMRDNVNDYLTKEKSKLVKYIHLINEKM